ncbi:pteridine reductase [Nitrosomonas aestuarii]|uniref:Pteridine reductase n=1 Tax=Nitrosomonas aestuarii TaxID=52441 RepID=A0A1I4C7K6_9PROT|nr:pteridine reductase [Nitrosomonas aestuarii]SFK76279.1 pteridine reductase [Nitrosomonas aestuarii]
MQEKVILVTGGAKRVGAAICRRLHAQGARITIHYRSSAEEARALQHEFTRKRPDSASVAQADLLDIDLLPELIEKIIKRYGRLDALINNASSFFATPLKACTTQAWDDLIGSNLMAPLFLTQAAAPYLKAQRGCVINIVDIHAERPLKNFVIYNAAKGGLLALTKSLALEMGPEVRVNGVSPGPILWPEESEWSDEAARRKIIQGTLLKRIGEPEDIAKTVQFLINDAPYITGQIIAVDGGRSIHL